MSSDAPHILAIQATFDGQRIMLPDDVRGIPPGKVIVIFENAPDEAQWSQLAAAGLAGAYSDDEPEYTLADVKP